MASNIIAQFTSSLRTGVAPLTVNFTNTSTGPYNSVMWDFGDGEKSSLINPSHKFINDGVYTVTLTIYDELSGTSQYTTTISVFLDTDYSETATTQQALFTSKRFGNGQVAVRKTTLDGSDLETEWPMSSATGFNLSANLTVNPVLVYKSGTTSDNKFFSDPGVYPNGWTKMIQANTSSYLCMFLKTGSTADISCSGHQMFIYKVVDADVPTSAITVDRKTPSLSGNTAIKFAGVVISSSGSTSITGNTFGESTPWKSLQASPTIDGLESLDIPNMYQPNVEASGILKYFEGNTSDGLSKLYIHPTYTGWNTVEAWKPSTVVIDFPFVMWHDKGVAGVTLTDSTVTYRDAETNLKYGPLTIEDDGTEVGKVFYEKKLIVIDDQELQASLNYLSNRNYTLPEPNVSTTSISDTTGGLQTGVTYYVTYRVRDGASDNYTGGTAYGTGNIQPLHCRYIQELTTKKSGRKFKVQAPASLWYTTGRTTSSDTGFTASVVDVLIGSATTTIADANWYQIENVGTYEQLNAGINLEFSTGGTNTASTFTTLSNSGTTNLAYGDDPVLFGYFSASSQSTIYKMSATCIAKNNEFNTTQNETFDEDVNESVYISEVGLYNESNELLMTGKLNTPIEKNDKKFVTVKLELDL